MVQQQLAFNTLGYKNSILQGKKVIRSFDISSFDGIAYNKNGPSKDRITLKAHVLEGGLRYITAHVSDGNLAPLPFCAVENQPDQSVREYNILEKGRIQAEDGFFLLKYSFQNGLTSSFGKKFGLKLPYAKYSHTHSLEYGVSCISADELRLSQLVYSDSALANISRYGASKEPTEVFLVKILLSDNEFLLKARSVVFSHEVPPTYCTPSILRTESDEFVVSVRGGAFMPITARMAQKPMGYSKENQNLGLGDNLRLRISRLSKDDSGLKSISDPYLNLEVLRKLFGIAKLDSPDPVKLLDAITNAVVLGTPFDYRTFFAGRE